MSKSVLFISEIDTDFSERYFALRAKENRVFNDKEVIKLPYYSDKNSREWLYRIKSSNRILDYLKEKNKPLKILDIGCGNGWFSNLLSNLNFSTVTGLDVNIEELEQANRIFQKDNLSFCYGNIFDFDSFNNEFDIIILNASIQYFSDLNKLFSKLNDFLNENGEIHIIDSPFYKLDKVTRAKKRTRLYYEKMGFPDMCSYYHHHKLESLGQCIIMYRPRLYPFINRLLKSNPFYWILIPKK